MSVPMHPLLGVFLALLGFSACSSQYTIDGNSSLACLDGRKLYLRVVHASEKSSRMVNLDSCEVVHGRFSFGGRIDSIALAEVYMGNDVLMPVVLEGGQLLLQVDNYRQSVMGGPLNERLTEFLKERTRYENELWELDRAARNLIYAGRRMEDVIKVLEPRRKALAEKMEHLEEKFIIDNANNVLGPGYFMLLASESGVPVMTEHLRRIADNAPSSLLKNRLVHNFLNASGYVPSTGERRAQNNRK